MRVKTLIIALALLWCLFFAWSFVDYAITEPTGSGFVRGINRLAGFLGWQVAAFLVALAAFAAARLQPQGLSRGVRRLANLPFYVTAALWVLIVIAGIALFLLDRVQPDGGVIQ
ncbi:MAG: hypothetical protein Kilf2KO_12060 [Rhodospirillales bacterium]